MSLLSKVGYLGKLYADRGLLAARASTMGRSIGSVGRFVGDAQTVARSAMGVGQQVGAGVTGTGRMINRAGAGVHSTARMFYRAGVGVHRGWRRIPPVVRYGGFAGAVGTYAGIKATQGLISGWRSSFQGPSDLYNHAHRYSQLGSEKYRRNQGKMPENHLGHSGLVQSLSRLRHG